MTRRALLSLPFVAPIARALGVKAMLPPAQIAPVLSKSTVLLSVYGYGSRPISTKPYRLPFRVE